MADLYQAAGKIDHVRIIAKPEGLLVLLSGHKRWISGEREQNRALISWTELEKERRKVQEGEDGGRL